MKKDYLLVIASVSGLSTAWLLTEEGTAWADENTTLAVVIGVSIVLAALRLALPVKEWRTVAAAFTAAGLPLIARGVARKMARS